MSHPLPELVEIEELVDTFGGLARVRTLAEVEVGRHEFPIHAISLGRTDPEAPTFAMIGGVHGLERIGTHVVTAFMQRMAARLEWDRIAQRSLEEMRFVFLPLVNPGGMFLHRRGNPNGVDPMRNSPVHPDSEGAWMVGGHRISPRLPWYAGRVGGGLEKETGALIGLMESEVFGSRCAVTIDCHSGFGMVDRVWFPYAYTRTPFPHIGHVTALKSLLDRTFPHHVYRIEPQAVGYRIDGDAWDYLYDLNRERHPGTIFLPLTLEMGSWTWVKKNPPQALSRLGSFNPIKLHRWRRTLRRHQPLLDFLVRAVASPNGWLPADGPAVRNWEEVARRTWRIG